jgi:hypothetical protein
MIDLLLWRLAWRLEKSAEGTQNTIKVDFEDWYAIFGMPDRTTMRMLTMEFMAVTSSWRMLPLPCVDRDV